MNGKAKLLNCLLAVGAFAFMAAAASGQTQSKPKAAESQPLARNQFIAQMDIEFRKMDTDNNGQLTRTEIVQFARQRLKAEAEERNRAKFAELDSNKDGRLSPAEFAKLETGATVVSAELGHMDSNRDQQVSQQEYRTATVANFDRLDTDRNGIVTAAEMKAAGITPR